MHEKELKEIQSLKTKVEQHEATITQLLEIIATTNRRVSSLYDYHFMNAEHQILSSTFPPK